MFIFSNAMNDLLETLQPHEREHSSIKNLNYLMESLNSSKKREQQRNIQSTSYFKASLTATVVFPYFHKQLQNH